MLGPSDSGKTVYAFNELAWKGFHLPRDGESANQRLKMKAVPVYQTLNASDKYDPKTKFEEYIAQNVRGAINRALGEDRDGKLKLKMALSVFLDEAGARDEFMGDKEVLYGICQKLNGLADHVRLIVAGTGLDHISSNLSSATEVFKYRMQPWNQSNLLLAVRKNMNVRVKAENFLNAASVP